MTNGVRRLKQDLLQLFEQYMPGGMAPDLGGCVPSYSLPSSLLDEQSRAW